MYIISGSLKNRKLMAPKGDATRPTTSKLREALFNICQSYIDDARFLDVFAGSGAMGFEAISRGAQSATFIDASKDSLRCIRENAKTLDLERSCFPLMGDVFVMLQKLIKQKEKFDIIYMDPPYGDGEMSNQLVQLINNTDLLNSGGYLFIEDSRDTLISRDERSHLHLKSARQMGRAQLLQFEKKA